MKKLATSVLALAVLSTPIFATTGKEKREEAKKSVSITQNGDQQFDFQLKTLTPGKVDVMIFSEKGKLVHRDQFAFKKSFKVPFDLSNLDEGNYKFVVEGTGVDESQEVFVSKLSEEDVAAFFVPLDDNKVKVTVYHENTPVTIALYDAEGNRYFQEKLVGSHNFTQLFDLTEVNDIDMEMVVSGRKSIIRKSL